MRHRYVRAVGVRALCDTVVNACIGFRIWKHKDKRQLYRTSRAYLGQLYAAVGTFDDFVYKLCVKLCEQAYATGKRPSIVDGNVGHSDAQIPERRLTSQEVRRIVRGIPRRNRLVYFNNDKPGYDLRTDTSLAHMSTPINPTEGRDSGAQNRVQQRCLVCKRNTSRMCSTCSVPLHERVRAGVAKSCHDIFHSCDEVAQECTGAATRSSLVTAESKPSSLVSRSRESVTPEGAELTMSIASATSSVSDSESDEGAEDSLFPSSISGSESDEGSEDAPFPSLPVETPASVTLFGQLVSSEDAERVNPIHVSDGTRPQDLYLNDVLLNMLLFRSQKLNRNSKVKYVNTFFLSNFEQQSKKFGAESALANRRKELSKYGVHLTKTPTIFFPINVKTFHWLAAIVINKYTGSTWDRSLMIFDSARMSTEDTVSIICELYKAAGANIGSIHIARCPAQLNQYDCGLYVAHYFDMLIKGKLEEACTTPSVVTTRRFNMLMRNESPDMVETRKCTFNMIMTALKA